MHLVVVKKSLFGCTFNHEIGHLGKGTQSVRLTERYQICQISTGDLLRAAARDENSPEGAQIRRAMESGGLVEDNIVMSLIDKNLTKPECRHGVLFDGFPRTIYQGEQLEKLLASKQKRLDAVIEYAVSELFECIPKRSNCEL